MVVGLITQTRPAFGDRRYGSLVHGAQTTGDKIFQFRALPLLSTYHCGLSTASERLRAMAVVGSGGDTHAAKLILVILLVEDVPLFAAFQDFLFLRSDSLAHFQFDLLFVFQRGGQDLPHLLANRIAGLDEIYFFAFPET